jgi:hypothetical protein
MESPGSYRHSLEFEAQKNPHTTRILVASTFRLLDMAMQWHPPNLLFWFR